VGGTVSAPQAWVVGAPQTSDDLPTPEVYALEVVDHELPQSFGRMLSVEPPRGKPLGGYGFSKSKPNWPIFRNCGASR
jgi:hypothetical protein